MTGQAQLRQSKRAVGKRPRASERKSTVGASPPVKPVVNALRILKHLSALHRPDNVTNIARSLNLNTSTCFNILRTLAAEQVVDFNETSKSYAIGLGIAQLAHSALSDGGKIEVFRPAIEEIAQTYGVTVTLWKLMDRDRIVLLSVSRSGAHFHIQMPIGQRLPLFIGAFGRALAFYRKISKQELRAYFAKVRWENPPPFEQYWRDIQEVSKRGWAVDQGNFARGITSVGAPVFDRGGTIRHGLVASMFQGQLNNETLARLGKDLVAISTDIKGFF